MLGTLKMSFSNIQIKHIRNISISLVKHSSYKSKTRKIVAKSAKNVFTTGAGCS